MLRPLMLACTLAIGSGACAQTGRVLIPGTLASYWTYEDPHTGQNHGAVVLRSQENTLAFLTLKCRDDGEWMMFFTEPQPLFAEDNVFTLREQIDDMYRLIYKVSGSNQVTIPRLGINGYAQVKTHDLVIDQASADQLFAAFEANKSVTLRIEPKTPRVLLKASSNYTFGPAGFELAWDAVHYCEGG